MQGFLWLLLQMALLLLAAATLFFYLGWRWRGQQALAQASSLNASVDAEAIAAEAARQEKQAAQAALAERTLAANRETAELLEARERQRQLERELLRLAEELKLAKQTTEPPPLSEEPAAPPPPEVQAESTPPLELEPAPAPQPEAALAEPPAAAKPEPAAADAPKSGRPKKTPPEPKTDATRPAPSEILSNLAAKISSQQVLVGALNQEREGWQQRMDSFKAKASTDPAGFALTSKNLARSEAQYREAVAALKALHKQSAALEKCLAAPAPAESDDLTQIKGIKTALDQQLRAFGIVTYRQIALMGTEELRALSELLAFKNRAERDQWQRQARSLHRAKYGADPE